MIPNHVAIIMDGNARWAKINNLTKRMKVITRRYQNIRKNNS